MLLLSSWVAWGIPSNQQIAKAQVMLAGVVLAYSLTVLVTRSMGSVDIGSMHPVSAMVTAVAGFGGLAVLLLLSRTYYSRSFFLTAALFAIAWLVVGRVLKRRLFRPLFAVEAGAIRPEAMQSREICWLPISEPRLPAKAVDAVVADLATDAPDWQRFHTQCQVSGLALHHAAVISEQLTGRVSLEEFSQGHPADMRQRMGYAAIKRLDDLALVIATAPLTLPAAALLALAIKLDSPGPVLFIQDRIGQGGSLFAMFKFRSMRMDAEEDGAQFAGEDDARITRVGRFIRRTRLDELPQFWNVLKGQMSLIGPRPEQREFVERFEAKIPFYGYRHLVKPGITGWAQITQGYVASEADTREKLEYDLYYAKHCSFWLDLVIMFRTVRIIVTGFGAR